MLEKSSTAWTFTLLIVTTILPAYSQAPDTLWTKTYGGPGADYCRSLQQTSDGGYALIGHTTSFGAGDWDTYFVKTDSNGDTLWTRKYGGPQYDDGWDIQQTHDKGYIIVGRSNSFGPSAMDVYLIRTDSLGDTLWTRTYGGSDWDEAYAVRQIQDHGFIVAGVTESFGSGEMKLYLIRTDSVGDTLWTRSYGDGENDYVGWSVQETASNGYIVAGYVDHHPGYADVYLMKTDSMGDTLWTRKYGGSLNEYSYALDNTFDGGYIVAGRTSSYGMGMYDFYLIRTDSLGDTLWTRSYGGPAWDGGRSVQQTSDSGFIVVGWTDSFGPLLEYDIYAVKTDCNGNILWSNSLGGSDQDYGYSVIETSDFGYAIVGFTFSFGFAAGEFYLIKTAPDTLGLAETQVKTPAIHDSQLVFPNPFRDNIEISLSVETCENDISLEIIDITGRFIRDLQREDGTNDHSLTATWDGLSWHGKEVPQGIYFLVIRMQNSVMTSRIVKIR
jgi:hypothetical protein